MKPLIIIVAVLLISACTAAQTNEPVPTDSAAVPTAVPTPLDQQAPIVIPTPAGKKYADLPDLGAAPELENQVWLNTDQALRLADLRGKVVLLDMWTFG